MSEENQAQTTTGVEQGSVAENQSQSTTEPQTQTQEPTQGTDPQEAKISQIVAQRISQREAQIREEERMRLLQEMQQQTNQQTNQQQTQFNAGQQPLDWNQVNDQFYTAFHQNPAQTVMQLVSAVAQQYTQPLIQQNKAMEYRQNLMDLATSHPEEIETVAPLMAPILEKYPHLRESREGLEIAFNAARGQQLEQHVQAAIERERQLAAQNQQAAAGMAPQGTANQQGGNSPGTPEDTLRDMIKNA